MPGGDSKQRRISLRIQEVGLWSPGPLHVLDAHLTAGHRRAVEGHGNSMQRSRQVCNPVQVHFQQHGKDGFCRSPQHLLKDIVVRLQ